MNVNYITDNEGNQSAVIIPYGNEIFLYKSIIRLRVSLMFKQGCKMQLRK